MKKENVNSFLKTFSKNNQITNNVTKFDISIAINKIFIKKIIEIEKLFTSTTNVKNANEIDCKTNDEK